MFSHSVLVKLCREKTEQRVKAAHTSLVPDEQAKPLCLFCQNRACGMCASIRNHRFVQGVLFHEIANETGQVVKQRERML